MALGLAARLRSNAMERSDKVLLATFLLAATLGTWTRCLLVNDGAVYITAAWIGNTWPLFFDQNVGRTVSTLMQFGLAWALRPAFGGASDAFVVAAHVFYFAGPLVLWLILRAVEPHRVYSQLYLAVTVMMIFFTSEMIVGMGVWLIWLAFLASPRSGTAKIVASAAAAPVLAFTHPAIALLSLLFAFTGGVLMLRRAFPRPLAIAAGAMGIVLVGAYLILSAVFSPSNPTVALQQGLNKYDYVNLAWMLVTLWLFPMLATAWLLLLAPGVAASTRWHPSHVAIVAIGCIGIGLAAGGTGLLTYLFARHTASHVLAVALALAVVAPGVWLVEARRPLLFYSAIAAVAALSYNADLFLFGRFVGNHLQPGLVDVDDPRSAWPRPLSGPYGIRGTAKWAAGPDYQRDVVVPMYDWYRVTLAFYSYFRSDRTSVLFHHLGQRGDWIPFECGPLDRARSMPHDERDRMFLAFLSDHYCVR
jgi:hypothetical protein